MLICRSASSVLVRYACQRIERLPPANGRVRPAPEWSTAHCMNRLRRSNRSIPDKWDVERRERARGRVAPRVSQEENDPAPLPRSRQAPVLPMPRNEDSRFPIHFRRLQGSAAHPERRAGACTLVPPPVRRGLRKWRKQDRDISSASRKSHNLYAWNEPLARFHRFHQGIDLGFDAFVEIDARGVQLSEVSLGIVFAGRRQLVDLRNAPGPPGPAGAFG